MSKSTMSTYFHHKKKKNGCTVWFFVIKINTFFVEFEDKMYLDSYSFILDKIAAFFEILLI